jgi:TolB-like protein/class 3 adenylate cyclase
LTGSRVERRLAAVLAADIASYSRLMGADEEGTLAQLKACRKTVVDPNIAEHRGRIVKTTGDGMLVEFASAVDAARCAVEVQRRMNEQNTNVPQDKRIEFRIGIHVGDIIIDENDIFGDGVNIAARLEGIAEPGGVCISDDAHRQIRGKIDVAYDDMGSQTLKNIIEPMRAWRLQIHHNSMTAGIEPQQPLALPEKPSIAVLPFQNMSSDPEQEYFADGMVEDIITALSRFKSLFVIARNSSFTYKGKAVDIKQVGRELGVRYVMEGSIRKAAGRVRITSQLIEASTGTHLWAEKIDGELRDVFDLQDQITAKVVSSVAPTIDRAEIERAKQRVTIKTDGYDTYLRGMEMIYRGQFLEARGQFKKATEQDPEYAAAYAMSAYTYSSELAVKGIVPTPEIRADALRDANTALSITSEDPFVLARCAHPMAYVCQQFDRAASLADRAVALNPNLSVAWLSRGWISIMLGKAEVAIESFENLLRLSPLDPLRPRSLSGIAFGLFFLDRYGAGCRMAKEIMQLFPHHQSFGAYIVNCVGAGDLGEAKRTASQFLKFDPSFRISRAADIFVIQTPELREKFHDALRVAGLPE